MTDMQAALGLAQLGVLDEILAERERLAAALHGGAGGRRRTSSRRTTRPSRERTWQSYAVRLGRPPRWTGQS